MRTAEDQFPRERRGNVPPERGAEWAPRAFWTLPLPFDQAVQPGLAPGGEISAYVNEGRWIAECPDCTGAQLASRGDRRFMCAECANVSVDSRWRMVVWPEDVEAIEGALKRRRSVNQHWLPGETVTRLKRENAVHGLGG